MARLLANPRSEVFFSGFRSDTYSLGQQGWQISVDENFQFARFDMMLHHPGPNLILHAVSRENPNREHAARRDNQYYNVMSHRYNEFDGPRFYVVRAFAANPNLKVFHEMPVFHIWSETRPTLVEQDLMHYNPFEFPIFQRKNEPVAEQLIVEPQDVMELLEQIKKMQAPEQESIRRRERSQAPLACATILTFGDAA